MWLLRLGCIVWMHGCMPDTAHGIAPPNCAWHAAHPRSHMCRSVPRPQAKEHLTCSACDTCRMSGMKRK